MGVVITALTLTGCRSQDAPARSSQETDYPSVDPETFALLLEDTSTFVLNVHTPDEGSLPGTDAAIPYDQLRRRSEELPDRSTSLAVYCRTGRMSSEAIPTLRDLGFSSITELAGGMEAWQFDGRGLVGSGNDS